MTPDDTLAAPFLAGTAKIEITCPDQGLWEDLLPEKIKKHIPPEYLRMSLRVSDPLYVRALYLDDGRQPLVLLTMDVTAIGARTISQGILSDSADDFVPRVRERAEAEFGLAPSHVNLFATHAHQVPRMLCNDQEQIERTLEAIRLAKANAQPAVLRVGRGRDDALTVNRTMMMADGSDYTIRSYHTPMPPNEQVKALRPVDPEIGLLRLDRPDGSPLAVLYVFGAHLLLGAPDGTTGTITADHVGVVLGQLEKHLGGDTMAFALQGAVGDSIEACQFDTDHPSTSRDFGNRLAESVLTAHRDAADVDLADANIQVATREVELALRNDIPRRIALLNEKQAKLLSALQYTSLNFDTFLPLYLKHQLRKQHPNQWAFRYMHAQNCGDTSLQTLDERNRAAIDHYLQSIRRMEQLALIQEDIATLQKHQEIIDDLPGASVKAELTAIKIGSFYLFTSPAEMFSETSLQFKAASPFDHVYLVSLANGYLHYAPPASYYDRGGYETTECLLDSSWQSIFDQATQDLQNSLQQPVESATALKLV